MKYLIKNQVINADHIVSVLYQPEDESIGEKSAAHILTDAEAGDRNWTLTLRGKDADLFWDIYSGDAYTVVNP